LELSLGGVYDADSIRGAAFSMFGCDVTPGDPFLYGKRVSVGPVCQELVPSMRTLATTYRPAVSVLMIGPENARGRVIAGDTFHGGTTKLESVIDRRLDRVRNALTVTGARLYVLPVQCDGITDVPAAKVEWLDQVLARYARAHVGQLTYVDDMKQTCTAKQLDPNDTWKRIAAAIKRS
jgi:hypothetical protein